MSLPDIRPYLSPKRHADPTDGVMFRWATARGVALEDEWFSYQKGKRKGLRAAGRKKLMKALGIPELKQSPVDVAPGGWGGG